VRCSGEVTTLWADVEVAKRVGQCGLGRCCRALGSLWFGANVEVAAHEDASSNR
jgi:hypothetical protein